MNDTEYKEVNGTSYKKDTPDAVIKVLESARVSEERIRIDYGFTENDKEANKKLGQSWGEENDIEGYVGRSTGNIKIPILVHNSASHGGGAMLDDCIVAIHTSTGKLLYKHEAYTPLIDWENAEIGTDGPEGYPFEVKGYNNREEKQDYVIARFEKRSSAEKWLTKRRKFEKPAKTNKKTKVKNKTK